MPPPQDYEHGPWIQSTAGRFYRTLIVQGRQYTQWDHEEGPVQANSTSVTPRTTDPRNQTGVLRPSVPYSQDSSHQYFELLQQDPVYQNSLFGSSTQRPNANATLAQGGDPRSYSQQRQRTDLDQNYRQDSEYVPRNTATSYAGQREPDASYAAYGDRGRLTGAQTQGVAGHRPSLGYHEAEATTQESSSLERSRTFPSGTKSCVIKDGCIYYLDEYKRVIDREPSRRESAPARPAPALEDLTTGFSRLGIDEADRKNTGPMANYQVQSQGSESDRPRHAGPHRRLSSTSKPPLASLREGKRLDHTRIKGSTRYRDHELDPRFILRTGKSMEEFFVQGRVFAMLWHESAGSSGTRITGSYTNGPFGKGIISKKRRMVLVKKMHGCSWCIPIVTYQGQGVTKSGLSVEDIKRHAIIYMTGTAAQSRPDERRLDKRAIEVKPSSLDQKLDPMSRLNFGKPYTVEHNIEAMDVGLVTEACMPYLVSYFQNVANSP